MILENDTGNRMLLSCIGVIEVCKKNEELVFWMGVLCSKICKHQNSAWFIYYINLFNVYFPNSSAAFIWIFPLKKIFNWKCQFDFLAVFIEKPFTEVYREKRPSHRSRFIIHTFSEVTQAAFSSSNILIKNIVKQLFPVYCYIHYPI